VRIIRLAVTTSTQHVARNLPVGTCVVADQQTAGRGRLDRTWETRAGSALLATFVLPARPLALFCGGVAAADACGPQVRIKWPNDLLLGGAKAAGLLAEQRGERCLLGMGVNLRWAPAGAATLDADPDQLLSSLIDSLETWWKAPAADVLEGWSARPPTQDH
jgi:biotin-(acetyl-CoA carboxylase) ligase